MRSAVPAELATACERALVAGARRVGSRQQLRAAARRFVRRHRRDGAYLRWVLRSVGASSALAVSLLGLGLAAESARAESTLFVQLTVFGTNPLAGQDVGISSTPALGDLDGDGDTDLLAGEVDGGFHYLENSGGSTAPAFAAPAPAFDPFDALDIGSGSAPAFGDLDGDGDLDMVSGERYGSFRTYLLPEPSQGLMLGAGIALLRWLRRRAR